MTSLDRTGAPTPAVSRPHLAHFFERIDPVRGRIIFALDATASRQPTWDTAGQLQTEMFQAVAALGGLEVQLVYYRGYDECAASRWVHDPTSLSTIMARIQCEAGLTKIARVLDHTRKANTREKISALILISDACEERPADLYAQARELQVPVFLFQEGTDEQVATIYAEIARLTGGATCRFDSGAAQRLGELLKAVAAFAAGGVWALAAQNTEAATLLLAQIKK
jgi:hypothetical protein